MVLFINLTMSLIVVTCFSINTTKHLLTSMAFITIYGIFEHTLYYMVLGIYGYKYHILFVVGNKK